MKMQTTRPTDLTRSGFDDLFARIEYPAHYVKDEIISQLRELPSDQTLQLSDVLSAQYRPSDDVVVFISLAAD
jgi:hypothetical protein